MSMQKIEVFVSDRGEPKVGIPPSQLTITFEGEFDKPEIFKDLNYANNREIFKNEIAFIVKNWFSEFPLSIVLEDECAECFAVLKGKRGHKLFCPSRG